MTTPQARTSSWRRAHRTFWLLLAIAIAAAGFLSSAVGAHPGPFTGVRVAISGTSLILAVVLAGRVFIYLDRARRAARHARTATPTAKALPN